MWIFWLIMASATLVNQTFGRAATVPSPKKSVPTPAPKPGPNTKSAPPDISMQTAYELYAVMHGSGTGYSLTVATGGTNVILTKTANPQPFAVEYHPGDKGTISFKDAFLHMDEKTGELHISKENVGTKLEFDIDPYTKELAFMFYKGLSFTINLNALGKPDQQNNGKLHLMKLPMPLKSDPHAIHLAVTLVAKAIKGGHSS